MTIKVLFIGAGPTSGLLAKNLSKCSKLNKLFDIFIWEKESVIGGRSATSFFGNTPADLGAQYLTQTKGQSLTEPYFTELLEAKLIQKMDASRIPGFRQDETKDNFFCPKGMGSIVEHFFQTACLTPNISFNKTVQSWMVDDLGKIQVTALGSNGTLHIGLFDIVISTIPIPQFLKLSTSESESIWEGDLKSDLSQVKYTNRAALAMYFDSKIELKNDEQEFNFPSRKQSQSPSDPVSPVVYWRLWNDVNSSSSSVVLHTNVRFLETQGFVEDMENPDEFKRRIESILMEFAFNDIKSIQGFTPVHVKCHIWKYSQVDLNHTYKGSPGFVEICKSPTMILAGDGLTRSGIEGCIESAQKTTDYLRQIIND